MTDRQNEIIGLIREANLTNVWLANRLGISKQRLGYQLNEADEMDYELYLKLKDLLNNFIENVNYKENPPAVDSQEIRWPKVVGTISAGRNGHFLKFYDDSMEEKPLNYDPDTHFWLRVDHHYGESMFPIIKPGDLVLISTKDKVRSGDLVAVLFTDEPESRGALKIYRNLPDDPSKSAFFSYNPYAEPIIKPVSDCKMYKVVLHERK